MVKRMFLCLIVLFLLCSCALVNSKPSASERNNPSKTSQETEIALKESVEKWIEKYNRNRSLIDDVSRCAFGNKILQVVEMFYYDADNNYAIIGIGGDFDEYAITNELQGNALYLNYERKIKKKDLEKNPVTGKIRLSGVSVGGPSDGFDIIFENEIFVAVRPRVVGDFYLSDYFVQNLNSCAVRYNIEFREH